MKQGKENYDWKIMLSMNNDVILLSVCGVLVLQLMITVLLVYYRSTKGKKPIHMFWNSSSTLAPQYAYVVTVVTGSRRGAGTIGEVRINIQGTISSNEDFVVDYNSLNENDLLQLLKRGSVDMYLITTDDPLGDIDFIEVALSTRHETVQWYLCYIAVLDLMNQVNWYFPCHQWLTASSSAQQTFVLLPDVRWHFSLLRDNLYRGMREFHSVLAPWCSILYASQLHAAYNSVLFLTIITCFMLTHVLVFCSPFTKSAKYGSEHFAMTTELNLRQIFYLIVADVFLAAIFTILQLLMHVVTLRSGAFFNNYQIVKLHDQHDENHGNSILAQSVVYNTDKKANIGHIFQHRIQELLHDKDYVPKITGLPDAEEGDDDDPEDVNESNNNNSNSNCLQLDLLRMWESVWTQLQPTTSSARHHGRQTPETESGTSSFDATGLDILAEKIVNESYDRIKRTKCDDLSSYSNEKLMELCLKAVMTKLLEACDDDGSIEIGSDCEINMQSCQPILSNTMQSDMRPVADYLSQYVVVKAMKNTMFWIESKSSELICSLVSKRARLLRQIRTAGNFDEQTESKKCTPCDPLWDYSKISQPTADNSVLMRHASSLSDALLSAVINASLRCQMTSVDAVNNIIDEYVVKEADEFTTLTVQSLLTSFKLNLVDQETLVKNGIMTESDATWMSEAYFLPLVTGFVKEMMHHEFNSLRHLLNDVKPSSSAVNFIHRVMLIVSLKIRTDLCKTSSASRKENAFIKRVLTEIGHLKNDELHRSSFADFLSKVKREILREQKKCFSLDLFEDIDYSKLEQHILLQVMACKVDIMIENRNVAESFYKHTFGNIDISSTTITKLVVHEANSLLDERLRVVNSNLKKCRVRDLTEFAKMLSTHQQEDASCQPIIKSVRNELWNDILGASSLALTRNSFTKWLTTSRERFRKYSSTTEGRDSNNSSNMNNMNKNDNAEGSHHDGEESHDEKKVHDVHEDHDIEGHNAMLDYQMLTPKASATVIATDRRGTRLNSSYTGSPAPKMTIKLVPEHTEQKLRDVWKGSRKYGTCIPTLVTYLLFTLVLFLCAVSIVGCLSIGTNLPTPVAYHWLSSVFTAVLIHAIVFEPLKVLLIALYFTYNLNKLLM